MLSKETLAVDTETTGLDFRTDKLQLVQIATEDGRVYMVRNPDSKSQNLKDLLTSGVTIIFHNAAFDLQFLKSGLVIQDWQCLNIGCTKTLMKILHPELSSGLGNTLEAICNIKIDKNIQHGHWGEELSDRQLEYAAGDVLYLHKLFKKLQSESNKNNDDDDKYYIAMAATMYISSLRVEGYTDLFDFPQNSLALTNQQRNWWLNKLGE